MLDSRAVKSRAGRDSDPQAGFTLIEIVCVLAILSIALAIVLPAIPTRTSRPQVQALALRAAAVLEADRNAAVRQGREVTTYVNAPARTIRAGASATEIVVPDDVTMETALASRCNGRQEQSRIRYFPSGLSCGGTIALTRDGRGYRIQINWLTGGVLVAAVP